MRNSRLDEAQAGSKITVRNINNLWYADNTTLMAEREEVVYLKLGQKVFLPSCVLKIDIWGFPGGSVVKNLPANAGDTGLTTDLGRDHIPQSN